MNRVVLIGRITRDPETKTTTSGTKVAEFSIAVDKRGRDEGANFFRVKAWGNQAEYVGNYLSKGRLVAIDGRLEQRSYEKDGQKREVIEVVAESVQGLDRPRDGAQPAQAVKPKPSATDDYDPFGDV